MTNKVVNVVYYNNNLIDKNGNRTSFSKEVDLSFDDYEVLIKKMKKLHKENNCEYVKTLQYFPLYIEENRLIGISFEINKDSKLEFYCVNGEMLSDKDIRKKASKKREEAKYTELLDFYIDCIKNEECLNQSFYEFIEDIKDKDIICLEDESENLLKYNDRNILDENNKKYWSNDNGGLYNKEDVKEILDKNVKIIDYKLLGLILSIKE